MNGRGRRDEVLAALRASDEPLSILQIAQRTAVHVNTVRFHLEALVDGGQVEQAESERTGPGRPALRFRAHRGMDPAGPRSYLLLAGALAAGLNTDPHPVDRAIEAGRAWGRQAAEPAPQGRIGDAEAIDRLEAILDDVGFAPEQRSAGEQRQIGLRHCPFLELIDTQSGVICPIHLGLMQGAMAAIDTDVTVERLDPFVEPDLCLAHLGRADELS